MHKENRVLCISGFDPSAHAGLLIDAKIFNQSKVPAFYVISAHTWQSSSQGIRYRREDLKRFKSLIEFAFASYQIEYIKIGMLPSIQLAEIVLDFVNKDLKIIWDPVMKSSHGCGLIDKDFLLHEKYLYLLEKSYLFTPNLEEASVLINQKLSDPQILGKKLYQIKKNNYLLIKGGHLKNSANDYLYDGSSFEVFKAEKIRGKFRGTGCRLASLITVHLFNGMNLKMAITEAKKQLLKNYIMGEGYDDLDF